MEAFRCMNHPQRAAVGQCVRCGKPVCEECFDAEKKVCRYRCGETLYKPAPETKSTFIKLAVGILAVLGGIGLLAIAICGAMIYSY